MRRLLALTSALLVASPAAAADDFVAPAAPAPERPAADESDYPNYGLTLEGGLFLGGFFPSAEHEFYDPAVAHRELGTHFELGGRGAVLPSPWGGLEGELQLALGATVDDGSTTLKGGRVHVIGQYPGLFVRELTPFGVIGAGNWQLTSDQTVLGNDTDGVFYLGAGVKYDLTHWMLARLDYRHTRADGYDGPGEDGSATGHNELLVGLSFVYGRPEPDDDRDGFVNSQDKCIEQPEDKDGFQDEDGCPDEDNDADGIADKNDACRDSAEDLDKFKDEDGCPEPDNDADGLFDPKDKCPNEAEDVDKFQDEDGCPDPDNDADGFLDTADKCPTEAGVAPEGCPDPDPDKDGVPLPQDVCPTELETKNGYQDLDGCPDEVPAEVAKFSGAIQGINFETGKASLTKDSSKTLDGAVAVMTKFLELKLEISGHTDDVGDRDRNVKLSEERAAAVKDYFVKKGIDASRLKTRGAGPDQPVADNKTKAGKAKNRRIEFKPISE